MKHFHYLNPEDKLKATKLFDSGETMDHLIKSKLINLDLSKAEDCKKAIDLAELSFKSKYKIFNKLNDMFKSTMDKRVTDGTVSKAEGDVFNILLGKRTQEKEAFLTLKKDYFETVSEKLNRVPNKGSDIPKPSGLTPENLSSMVPDGKSSLAEASSLPDKVPLTEEMMDIAKTILELFS